MTLVSSEAAAAPASFHVPSRQIRSFFMDLNRGWKAGCLDCHRHWDNKIANVENQVSVRDEGDAVGVLADNAGTEGVW